MKKLLLVSILVLFGCSKDSEAGSNPGDEIIGGYEISQSYYRGEAYRGDSPGTIVFSANGKGKVDILWGDNYRDERDFDWSFDGERWQLIDNALLEWEIIGEDCDGTPDCRVYEMYWKDGYSVIYFSKIN